MLLTDGARPFPGELDLVDLRLSTVQAAAARLELVGAHADTP